MAFANPRLADIATATGKSIQTVGIVMNGGKGNTGVSDATRQRIRKAAERLGYRTNPLAQAVRQGRTGSLGMLIATDSHRSYLPADLFFGLVTQADRNGYDIKLAHYTDAQLSREREMPRVFREIMGDGLLVNYFDNSAMVAPLRRGLCRHHIPAIWLNRDMPEDGVCFDDHGAGVELTQMMLADGLRRIAYVDLECAPNAHYSRRARPAGYADAMREAGLEPDVTLRSVARPRHLATLREWLRRRPRLDAIIGYSMENVAPPLIQLATAANRRFGDDLRFGFFGSPDELFMFPHYVMVQQNRAYGEAAVHMLIEKIRQPDMTLATQRIPFEGVGPTGSSARSGAKLRKADTRTHEKRT
ncbi:MAG: hypothetical protein A3K19_06680 [Lentisphaerae bacterium RIFOXYB12_FULL_65_16]|nr:MAG: hypothetical protein A3K18_07820 [Lentisphaerae bacterium RIFOXYA12_64_32]OGV93124.1 MAG: hypothetical protein A3K19_06680 [Lentisphaerae bacterium RIFOXYB12_FULL_65_16]